MSPECTYSSRRRSVVIYDRRSLLLSAKLAVKEQQQCGPNKMSQASTPTLDPCRESPAHDPRPPHTSLYASRHSATSHQHCKVNIYTTTMASTDATAEREEVRMPCKPCINPMTNSSQQQRLKSALWYTIGQYIDEECLTSDLNATPQFIGALTELVYTQIGTLHLLLPTHTHSITI